MYKFSINFETVNKQEIISLGHIVESFTNVTLNDCLAIIILISLKLRNNAGKYIDLTNNVIKYFSNFNIFFLNFDA